MKGRGGCGTVVARCTVLILCAGLLSGCFFGSKTKACHKPQEYQSSTEVEKLQVPDELDAPNREGALVIAEGARATQPVPQDQPCPEQPPDYFGVDSG
ncbi:MAG: hypothetical protein OER85_18365 [Gammaproteobacteria bacterium]|nr:hypothetical protein [Gammaproteobacteria bacterium]